MASYFQTIFSKKCRIFTKEQETNHNNQIDHDTYFEKVKGGPSDLNLSRERTITEIQNDYKEQVERQSQLMKKKAERAFQTVDCIRRPCVVDGYCLSGFSVVTDLFP